jgi:hypothetical protein
VAEVFISGWSRPARAWQAAVLANGFFAVPPTTQGAVLPLGWDRPQECIGCVVNGDCPPEWPVCYSADRGSFCGKPGDTVNNSLLIDSLRSNYIFLGKGEIPAIDESCSDPDQFRFGSLVFDSDDAPVYVPPPKYAATMALEVRPGSCGTFTIAINDSCYIDPVGGVWRCHSFVLGTDDLYVLPLVVEPLRINVTPACGCSSIRDSNPKNCAIDARQPSRPDGSFKAGWNSIELTFDPPGCPASAIPETEFIIDQVPAGVPPAIDQTVPIVDKLTLVFDRRISLKAWTCVQWTRSGQRVCMAHMPADVNADRTSGPVDILATIDNLNGQVQPPYPIYQCDVDRYNACAPADILRVIDLLNGADAYEPWLGQSLQACPSAP